LEFIVRKDFADIGIVGKAASGDSATTGATISFSMIESPKTSLGCFKELALSAIHF
jgi:hypothetical protein